MVEGVGLFQMVDLSGHLYYFLYFLILIASMEYVPITGGLQCRLIAGTQPPLRVGTEDISVSKMLNDDIFQIDDPHTKEIPERLLPNEDPRSNTHAQ